MGLGTSSGALSLQTIYTCTIQQIKSAMSDSYAYFPKALLSLLPSDVMTRLCVFLYR